MATQVSQGNNECWRKSGRFEGQVHRSINQIIILQFLRVNQKIEDSLMDPGLTCPAVLRSRQDRPMSALE